MVSAGKYVYRKAQTFIWNYMPRQICEGLIRILITLTGFVSTLLDCAYYLLDFLVEYVTRCENRFFEIC